MAGGNSGGGLAMKDRVAIIGGGLAGLAAASALATHDLAVTLLEARPRLGGRAASFVDAASGQVIDVCQHVSMGCCTNFAHLCRTFGVERFLETQKSLYFVTPDRRCSAIAADPLPAPFHLARAFFNAHYLSLSDKARIAWGLARLRLGPPNDDPPFRDWLRRHRQTTRTIRRFWAVVLVSALNEDPERVGLRYARKVFVDGFLRHRRGFEVELPRAPLGRLYGKELLAWFDEHQVRLMLGRGARRLIVDDGGVRGVELRDGAVVEADWYVAAVPFDRLLALVPPETVEAYPYFSRLNNLETSPITSVHLWFDRPVTRLPHAVLLDGAGHWLFNRGESAPGEHYLQVVVSAARELRRLGHAEVQRRIAEELSRYFPGAGAARLLRGRVATEHAATFSAAPGVDRWRPQQASPIPNLFTAGDWTATGWPATMEGAVRSGYLAAEALLERRGAPMRLLQPDL
jgi:squalene-associated FAD-dependent desaturase